MEKKKLIHKLVRRATTCSEVLHLVDGKCNVIIGDDIKKFRSIDQILEPYSRAFIMYKSAPNYGHWCAITKRGDTISLFDPYGKFIEEYNDMFGTSHRGHLAKLLVNNDYKIEYSDHKFQTDYSSTCGLWCSLFLIFCRDISIDEFIEQFRGLREEQLVCLFYDI